MKTKIGVKKVVTAAMASVLIVFGTVLPASAAQIKEELPKLQVSEKTGSVITPFADVIQYQLRTYQGKLQYRRWNSTKGYWVDPYWIDMKPLRS